MSKYTKEEVIKDRRSGLKYFDECVAIFGKNKLFEEAIKISKQFPDIWGPGWPNLEWAFRNACNEMAGRGVICFNLNEALTEDEMKYFAKELNLKMEEYIPLVKRKVVKLKQPKI